MQFFAIKEAKEIDHDHAQCANLLLRNEKELLSSLKHPGIIRIIDDDFQCPERTRKSMLMEYCSAGSLFDFIQGFKAAKYDAIINGLISAVV